MRYRIVAYGPGRKCLTWADDANLALTEQWLKREGYIEITKEEEQ